LKELSVKFREFSRVDRSSNVPPASKKVCERGNTAQSGRGGLQIKFPPGQKRRHSKLSAFRGDGDFVGTYKYYLNFDLYVTGTPTSSKASWAYDL
jgi:hypothetical protein